MRIDTPHNRKQRKQRKKRILLPLTLVLVSLAAVVSAQPIRRPTPLIDLSGFQSVSPRVNPSAITVARLHYSGGGDWYWGRSALPNFLSYLNDNSCLRVDTIEREIKLTDADLYQYPFLFATGHGLISFTDEEAARLREYLAQGGFLFVNDSYGMAESFLKQMAALFPEREVTELPFDHPLYHAYFDFPNGPPKIHEHDGQPPRGYAILLDSRVVLYFLVESDIGDGWEDPQVHSDPEDKRELAFQMGVNIITYALLN